MRNMSILTRVLALVLSVVLVLTGMPMAVFAEEIATPTELEQPEETATATEEVVEEVPVTEEEQPAEEEVPAEGEIPVLDDSQLPVDVVDELAPSDDPVEEAPEYLPTDDGEQVELPDQEEIPEENTDEIPPVEDEIIVEDEPADDMPEEEELYFEDEIATEPEEITEDEHPVKVMLEASGYAYVMTDDAVSAYADADLQEYMCSIAPGSALLVTAFIELDAMDVLEVQFMADACELAYVDAADLPEAVLTDDDLAILYQTAPFALILLDGMEAAVFAATVEYPIEDEQPVEVVPPVEDVPVEQPTEEDAVVEAPIEAPIEQLPEESGDELPEEDPLPVEDEELPGEVVVDPEGEILLPEEGELLPDASEEMTEDEQEPADEVWVAQEGDFVLVSPDTRAFLSVDDTAAEDYEGDLAIGFFVNDAAVQVETVEQDFLDRWWYRITFMYGDDHADGSLKWTDFDTLYVLAEETEYTDAQDFDVTDYAFPFAPRAMTFSLRSTMQTLDMLYSASTNKQFITVQTRAGETYYMVIDYDKPIDEENEIYETYFLNLVDDRDLMSVVSEDEIQPTPTPQIVYVTPEPTEVPVQPTPIPVEDDEPAAPSSATLLLIVGIAAIAGAAFWFVKGKKNNAAPSMDDYEDEYEFEDEEDESDA